MFLNIGFGNFVSKEKIVAILNAESSPAKRLMRSAKENNSLIDATCGRKTRSVLTMESGHVVLSSLGSDAIFSKNNEGE